jgi:hypothetical protein
MTGVASPLGVLQSLLAQLAAFAALLLLASALHKLIGRGRALAAAHEFGRVPRRLAPFALVLVGSIELFAALLLCSPVHRAIGAGLAVLIWGGYLALILTAIAQGRRDVDCGCTFGASRRPLGAYQVCRAAVLTGAALLVAVGSAAFDTDPLIAAQFLAALALLALYGALDQVMALTAPRSGELL